MPWFRRRKQVAPSSSRSSAALTPDGVAIATRLEAAAPEAGRELARALLPSVRFAVARCDDGQIPKGSSKFGGAADLPRDLSWPTWVNRDGEVRELKFFAQIELGSAVRAAPAPLGLPDSGLLSFFVDFDMDGDGIVGLYPWEQAGSTVLHTPAHVELVRRAPPANALPAGAFAPLPAWTWSHASLGSADPSDEEYDRLDELEMAYERELAASVPSGWALTGRHQLGGHARYIQHPIEEEVVQAVAGCFAGASNFDHGKWNRVKHQVAEWRLLLQIDSDDTLDVMWGDVGTLFWAARQADIDAGRWDAGMFNFQCS